MVHVQARDRGRRGQHRQRLHVVCYVPDQYEVLGEIQLLLFFLRISNLRAEQLLLLLFLLLLVLKTQGRNRHNHHRHCVVAIVRERRNRFLARVARVLQSLHLQQGRLATGLIVRLVLRLCEHRISHVVAHERPERVLLRLGEKSFQRLGLQALLDLCRFQQLWLVLSARARHRFYRGLHRPATRNWYRLHGARLHLNLHRVALVRVRVYLHVVVLRVHVLKLEGLVILPLRSAE